MFGAVDVQLILEVAEMIRKEKEEDPLSLEFIQIYDELYTLLQNYTKIKVIKVYKAEADDVLFELSKTTPEKKGEKHLVYSGDKDISQCISEICDFFDFFNGTKIIILYQSEWMVYSSVWYV